MTAPAVINITHDNSGYSASPPNDSIPSTGSVKFHASQACRVCTSPTGVFGDGNGYINLQQGDNGPYSPRETNVTVHYCIADPGMTCTPGVPHRPTATGGYTITVGSTSSDAEKG